MATAMHRCRDLPETIQLCHLCTHLASFATLIFIPSPRTTPVW